MKKPFFIGIVGGTGAGKSTFIKNLRKKLPNKILVVSYDRYYKDQSKKTMAERKKTNYDHPASLDTNLLIKDLKKLRRGEVVDLPIYDYVLHNRLKKTDHVRPKAIIIVDGIFNFHFPALRKIFDLKIFIDIDADIRFGRRIQRDIKKRGRSFIFAHNQYLEFVRPMHKKFVEPTKKYADIIIPKGGMNKKAIDIIAAYIKNK